MSTRVVFVMGPSTRAANRPSLSMIIVDGIALGGSTSAKFNNTFPAGSKIDG